MNYHNITTDDMRNGDGLRVVLWVSGCSHHCYGCHNSITWDPDSGIQFNHDDLVELLDSLDKDYISGLTISGGDPFYEENIDTIKKILMHVKQRFPGKTVWVYTGYDWEELINIRKIHDMFKNRLIDVLVDGKFIKELEDVKYQWAGSTNQRVIDVNQSLNEGRIVLHASN